MLFLFFFKNSIFKKKKGGGGYVFDLPFLGYSVKWYLEKKLDFTIQLDFISKYHYYLSHVLPLLELRSKPC